MEPPGATIGGSRSSALPRLSKLPQPRSTRAAGSADEGQSIQHSGVASPFSAVPSRPNRSNTMEIQRPGTTMKSPTNPLSPLSPTNKRQSMLIRPGFQTSALREPQGRVATNVVPPRSPPSPMATMSDNSSVNADDDTTNTPKPGRKPRPSLSDRTVETLSQVPPTPPSRHRQSGFYNLENPMRPPSRAASSLSFSRPDSRAGSSVTGIRPPSPSKRPTAYSGYGKPPAPSPSKKSSASSLSQIRPAANSNQPRIETHRPTKMKPASSTTGLAGGVGTISSGGHNKSASRSIAVRSPTKEMFGGPLPGVQTAPDKPTKRLSRPLSMKPGQFSSLVSPSATKKPQDFETIAEPAEDRKNGQPQSLREAISKAKAARKSSSNQSSDAFTPRSIDQDVFTNLSSDVGPNTLELVDSTHFNIVKKRIHNARTDGKLNIAALCLTEIPVEVLKMYEFDPNNKSGSAWYETVDVTRILAADNEIRELPAELFPGRKLSLQSDPYDEEAVDGVFGSLQVLDMHGNQLISIPSNIGNLESLTSLNLSKNKLDNGALKVISTITCLKELRIGENLLSGSLVHEIGNLENLELLDVQKNSILELPSGIGKLSHLKSLNVSDNRLSTLPFEAIFDLPLLELVASRNRLSGPLLPNSIPHIPSLRTLDVSVNALTCITESKVDFPALQNLNICNNRIYELPDISTWAELRTLNAEENKISAIPEGFTKLSKLSNVDLGNNSLLQLDDAIGFMDNLAVLRIGNNPIRDRRLLRMEIEELKSELRCRQSTKSSTEKESNREFTTSPGSSTWPVSGGIVDRSNTKLSIIERKDIEALEGQQVRSLVLQHNLLMSFSPAIELLGSTLTSLDLSNNKVGRRDEYMLDTMCLPNLQTLNLSSNTLTTLDPLVTHLSAPRLATLIVTHNRLTELPLLCEAFPSLTKLLASSNKINVLNVDSIRGLQVLDLSSNEIELLPPKLGILQGQLRLLMIGGNRFRVPSWNILQKGTEEILRFCKNRIPAGEEGAVTNDVD